MTQHPSVEMTQMLVQAPKARAFRHRNSKTKTPEHQMVYETLRRSILFGDYAPGQALTIQGLVDATQSGMTPVREAIRRLTSEGALVMLSNRRLTVPVLSRKHAQQLAFMRDKLEPHLAGLAAMRTQQDDLERLLAIDSELNSAIATGDIPAYLELNHAFHSLIYRVSGMTLVAQNVDLLWLQFGPSLRSVCGQVGTNNLPDMHVKILDALRNKNADGASDAMREDIAQGMTHIINACDSIDRE